MPTVAPASEPTSGLEAFWELERFLSEAGAAGLALAELERGSERRGRELLRLSLQAHLDSRGDGDVGEALLLDAADGPVRLTHKRAHTRSLVTIFGEVQLVRVGYGARGRPSIHPLDAELQLPARSYSYELCRRLCKGAVLGLFEEAVALIEELTAVKIPKRSGRSCSSQRSTSTPSMPIVRATTASPGRGAETSARAGRMRVGNSRNPTSGGSPVW